MERMYRRQSYNDVMRRVVFISAPAVWQVGHGPNHPLKPERLRRTHELLEAYGLLRLDGVQVVAPRLAAEAELRLFHTPEYLRAVRALSTGEGGVNPTRYNFGAGDNPVFSGMYESEGLKVGSAVQAADLLLGGECDVAFSYSGGLHHGAPARASGFCVFNDAAVAIHHLLQRVDRIAYVDIDVHHGDGVQDAFYESDRVLTISLHQDGRTLFPGTGFVHETGRGAGAGTSVNVPLPPGTDDESYVFAFEETVPALLERFRPEVVVTQLGVDTHRLDPLAALALTTHGHQTVFERLASLAPVWLALGGGGYHLDVVPRSWALAFGVMIDHELPRELPQTYRQRYGGATLHDPEPGGSDRATRHAVEQVVRQVRETHRL